MSSNKTIADLLATCKVLRCKLMLMNVRDPLFKYYLRAANSYQYRLKELSHTLHKTCVGHYEPASSIFDETQNFNI